MPTKYNAIANQFDLVNEVSDLVVGPASATDSAIALFDGTTGVLLKDSETTLSTDGTLAGDSDTLVSTQKAVKTYVDGAIPPAVMGGTAASHQVNTTTSFPPISYRDFGSLEMLVRSFAATGPEYMQGFFQVPIDLGSGAVRFDIIGSASTAQGSKNVKFTFDFIQAADDGLLTGAYSGAQGWDDQPISSTQNDQDIISNTVTVANLGFVAGRTVFYRLYREAASTNNLTVDYDVMFFNIDIPRA